MVWPHIGSIVDCLYAWFLLANIIPLRVAIPLGSGANSHPLVGLDCFDPLYCIPMKQPHIRMSNLSPKVDNLWQSHMMIIRIRTSTNTFGTGKTICTQRNSVDRYQLGSRLQRGLLHPIAPALAALECLHEPSRCPGMPWDFSHEKTKSSKAIPHWTKPVLFPKWVIPKSNEWSSFVPNLQFCDTPDFVTNLGLSHLCSKSFRWPIVFFFLHYFLPDSILNFINLATTSPKEFLLVWSRTFLPDENQVNIPINIDPIYTLYRSYIYTHLHIQIP